MGMTAKLEISDPDAGVAYLGVTEAKEKDMNTAVSPAL